MHKLRLFYGICIRNILCIYESNPYIKFSILAYFFFIEGIVKYYKHKFICIIKLTQHPIVLSMLFAVYFFVKKIINAWCGFIEKFFVVFKVQLIFFFIYNMFCLSLFVFFFYYMYKIEVVNRVQTFF